MPVTSKGLSLSGWEGPSPKKIPKKKRQVEPRDRWYHSAGSAVRIRRTCPSSPRSLPPGVFSFWASKKKREKTHDRQFLLLVPLSAIAFLVLLYSFF